MPLPVSQLAGFRPYQPGLSTAQIAKKFGLEETSIIKLASNENPLGPSPLAVDAFNRSSHHLHRYPEGAQLRAALAAFYAVDLEAVVLGNGSNDVLDIVARAFAGPGDECIYSEHAFAVYGLVCKLVGATAVQVPAKSFGHDLDAMLAAITDKTKIIWIANPNNPTGTFHTAAHMKSFIERVPSHILIVLDEAYYEYLDAVEQSKSELWLETHKNLVIVRTFSKIYGLAGLRIGYALCSPQVAATLQNVRQPFNANLPALAAAEAALSDQSFVQKSREANKMSIAALRDAFDERGLTYMPAFGNFVTVLVPDAESVSQLLLARGIIVRQITEYGLSKYLRVSGGTADEISRFVSELNNILDTQ